MYSPVPEFIDIQEVSMRCPKCGGFMVEEPECMRCCNCSLHLWTAPVKEEYAIRMEEADANLLPTLRANTRQSRDRRHVSDLLQSAPTPGRAGVLGGRGGAAA
jgi:hypothetical protein